MSEQVDVYEATTQLSALLARVEAGEEIVIARHGRPVARLVPEQRSVRRRELDGLEGRIRVVGDWQDADEEIADLILAGNSTCLRRDEAARRHPGGHLGRGRLAPSRGRRARSVGGRNERRLVLRDRSPGDRRQKGRSGSCRSTSISSDGSASRTSPCCRSSGNTSRRSPELPLHHRDPLDRMLGAQARHEGLTLVTADRRLEAYSVAVLNAEAD